MQLPKEICIAKIFIWISKVSDKLLAYDFKKSEFFLKKLLSILVFGFSNSLTSSTFFKINLVLKWFKISVFETFRQSFNNKKKCVN